MNVAAAGKAALGLGGRAAGLLGGPVGWAISAATSIPLLIDLVRSFTDGGEDNVDPQQIAAMRDKVVAELVAKGKTPEQAKAQIDEMMRPLIEGVAAGRENEPTGSGEMLASGALALAGAFAGRKFGKGRMAKTKDAPKDNPRDVATVAPHAKPVHENAPDYDDLGKPGKMGDPREELFEGEVADLPKPTPLDRLKGVPATPSKRDFVGPRGEVRRMEQERGLRGELDDVSGSERGMIVPDRSGRMVDDPGVITPEYFDPTSEEELRLMAAMSHARSMPRRPPGAYRAPPERLGVGRETLEDLMARSRQFTPRTDMGGVDVEL